MKVISRNAYLDKIRPFIDVPIIKVITGIRRCGKSFLFIQIINELLNNGIKQNQIHLLNMDDLENIGLLDGESLYSHISPMMKDQGKHYIFIDEVQNVSEWERAINSLLLKGNVDIYISGSNSNLLSSELTTFIAGRYVSICMETLSFSEFIEFRREFTSFDGDGKTLLNDYIRRGGFPIISTKNFDTTSSDNLIKDIFDAIVYKDTIARNNIRNGKQLEIFLKFMLDNVGNPFSARSISRAFSNNGINFSPITVLKYLDYLERSYLLRKVQRYDIRGKRIIASEDKYYVSDVSLIYALNGYEEGMISGIEENIVYLELLRRGYSTYVGRTRDMREIDFIGEKDGRRIYVQVTHTIESAETARREFSPFDSVPDNFPKYVVVANNKWDVEDVGIIQIGLAEFLLLESY